MSLKSVFFNGNLDKPYHLEESEALFVIRVKKNEDPIAIFKSIPFLKNVLAKIELKTSFPQSNVYIFKCLSAEEGFKDAVKLAIKEAKNPGVIYVGSVLEYAKTGIYQIYTENIFIKFFDTTTNEFIVNFFKTHHLENKRSLNFGENVFFVELIESIGREIFPFCEHLLTLPEVECCHPELVTKLQDPFKNFNDASVSPIDLEKDWWLQRTKVHEAWQVTKGKGITIAVIDDGLEMSHKAFRSKIVFPRDMLDKNARKFPIHRYNEGHGTACASVACSADEEAIGVAPEAKIMPIKVTGMGSVLQSEAFYWAVQHNADVISCSWGPPDGNIFSIIDDDFDFPLPDHTRLAFEYATKYGRNGKGCAIVFAAGNGNEPVKYDGYASSKNVIAVSAVNYKNELAIYADYGEPTFCCFPSGDFTLDKDNKPILTSGILVADRFGENGYATTNYYSLFNGTSASCPGVAGIIALIYSVNPNLKITELKEILINSCEKIGAKNEYNLFSYSHNFGYGLLRADFAINNTMKSTNQKNNSMSTTKKQAVSLHVGINEVSQQYYKGYVPPLYGCVNDMEKMGELAKKIGYETNFLKNSEATREAIKEQIIRLGNSVEENGILLITYAGHGAPIPDKNNDVNDLVDGNDGNDEAWVSYDGFLLDDEIHASLAQIKHKIRVVVISDSCHSESMSRFFMVDLESIKTTVFERSISSSQVLAILDKNNQTTRSIRENIPAKESLEYSVYVIALSACEKDEKAKEVGGQGVFTKTFINNYIGSDNKNYQSFIDLVKAKISDSTQKPKLTTSHHFNKNFLAQSPLSIEKINLQSTTNNQSIETNSSVSDSSSETTLALENEFLNTITEDLFVSSGTLLVETTDESNLIIDPENSLRSLEASTTLKIKKGVVDAKEIKGHTEWDKAYNLLLNNKSITSVEPESVSNLYVLDNEVEAQKSRDVGEYLDTYPNPERCNNRTPFIWHLDEEHSQLKLANEHVFPEIKMEKRNANTTDLVKIGQIDTGFLEDHPALPENLDPLHANFCKGKKVMGAIDGDATLAVAEQHGHGNATLSILAGNWVDLSETDSNYRGFFGAIPYAKVLPIKISETVALLSGRNFALAVDYAIEQGCDVITMSMAGLPSKTMAKAVNRAYEAGVVIVSAASNSFSENFFKKKLPKKTLYPARYHRVIAATGACYNHKPYLNRFQDGSCEGTGLETRGAGGFYMQTCYGPEYVLRTSVAAYTPNISWFSFDVEHEDGSKTYYVKNGGGTSSATPQVAAAAAIYIQKYKQELAQFTGKNAWKKAEIVRQALFQSADDSTVFNYVYGNGILKAYDALHEKYAPKNLIHQIKKEEKAPEKRRFLGGIFHVFSNRSITAAKDDSLNEKLADMMITEICQLLHKDENLFDYLDTLNLDDEDFSLLEHKNLIRDILKSRHASDFLKQNLRTSFSEQSENVAVNQDDFSNVHFKGVRGGVSIKTTNLSYKITNKKSYKEYQENNAFWVDEFELTPSETRSLRSDLVSELQVSLEEDKENLLSVMLVEKVFEDGSVFEWKQAGMFDNAGNRSIENHPSLDANTYYFKTDVFNSNERGILDVLKRIGIKIFKWKKEKISPKTRILDKLVAKLGENKYEIKVFDLKEENSLAKGWVSIDLLDAAAIYASIQKDKKPVLVCMPGLFSSVESGFDDFLEDAAVKTQLLKKHGQYILGCNMPTVVQGIEANAKHISELLSGKLKQKECTVLARSRGGIVARYLFEQEWLDNRSNKLFADAPLALRKLVFFGTPNQGTMMASSKNWKSLLNYTTNIARVALGTIAPIVPRALTILKAMAIGFTDLPGIDDLEEESNVILKLNSLELNRDNYFVFTSNYEPNQKLLKRLFDEYLVDRAIFKRQPNDTVTPVDGAIFSNENFASVVALKEGQYYIASTAEQVTHFGYLHPKHPQIIEKLFKEI
ncbi:S8 family serine peptidase [Polaribacter sp.]|uniref:S8 family serine peptidase n=1 Tax=Polaribacter sp. TaxID=1920175 RepID=UPI003EFA2E39